MTNENKNLVTELIDLGNRLSQAGEREILLIEENERLKSACNILQQDVAHERLLTE